MVVIYHAVHLIDLLKNLYYHHVTSAKLYEAIKYFARRQIIVSYNIKLNWTTFFQYKRFYYRNLMPLYTISYLNKVKYDIAVLGGGGYFGYNMYMGASHDESHDDSHEQTNHDDDQSSEETHVNDSIVKDVEAKIEEAEKGDQKDSTIEDIKDAAEAIHLIAH